MNASRLILILRRRAGIDSHVLATLLSRGWVVIAGAITVLLIPIFFSAIQQGYYYTFSSLVGLQILFELGLGQVILQTVSHEMAHLHIDDCGRLKGDEVRQDRLASLMQLLSRWYKVAAFLFAVIAGFSGAYFLSSKGNLPLNDWLGVWSVLILCTAINLTYTPTLAFMDGCGKIGLVARLRLVQSVVGYAGMWLALTAGFGLWAACVVPLTASVLTGYWLNKFDEVGVVLRNRAISPANALNWRRDVLPFQWRIALSALSGYFTFYLMTPLVFANHGAAEAGTFGIAIALFKALEVVGTSWIYAETPKMAMYVSRNERDELNRVFRAVLIRSFIFSVLSAGMLLLLVLGLHKLDVSLVNRISEPSVLVCLAIVSIANCVIFAAAAYMRAHRVEPMMPVSLGTALLTTIVVWYGSKISVLHMTAAYAAITIFVTLPWTLIVLSRYVRRPV